MQKHYLVILNKRRHYSVKKINMQNKTESIWNACGNGLKYFILKRVSDPTLADDLFQEVFLKIHSKIDSLKDDTRICGWVYSIARNTIIDHYRQNKTGFVDIETIHLVKESDDENPDQETISDNTAIPLCYEENEPTVAQEIAAGLKEMVESLPGKYAKALLLVEFEGVSQIELANKLGISVAGAKSRVQRGRQMLKDLLMRCCHFEFDKYGTIINSHPVKCCCCN